MEKKGGGQLLWGQKLYIDSGLPRYAVVRLSSRAAKKGGDPTKASRRKRGAAGGEGDALRQRAGGCRWRVLRGAVWGGSEWGRRGAARPGVLPRGGKHGAFFFGEGFFFFFRKLFFVVSGRRCAKLGKGGKEREGMRWLQYLLLWYM